MGENAWVSLSRHEVALKQRSQSFRNRCYPPIFVELSLRPLKVMVAPDEGLGGKGGGGGVLHAVRTEPFKSNTSPGVDALLG